MRRMIRRPKKLMKEMRSVSTASGAIEYCLKRSSARRTLAIAVDERASVSVSVPFRATLKDTEGFIHEKAQWIIDKVHEARTHRAYVDEKKFDDGNSFLFLGKKYLLSVQEASVKRVRLDFDGNRWAVCVPQGLSCERRREMIRKKLFGWYRTQAEEVLGGRLFHYARDMEVEPKKIAIRTQKRIWGCCDYHAQTIHLNWQIILSPLKVIDYVVVHELCHLIVPNHSKRFWRQVAKVMPEYTEHKEWLKNNHLEMILP